MLEKCKILSATSHFITLYLEDAVQRGPQQCWSGSWGNDVSREAAFFFFTQIYLML